MAGTNAFQVEGVVREALANGTYRVELANGHRLLGFVTGRARRSHAGFAPGATVKLNLTPYDMSSGRILVGSEKDLI
jgi:translation initiation factor IF-1